MPQTLTFSIPGALGTNQGAASDGVLIGQLTATDPDKVLLKSLSSAGLCYTDDGGSFVDETTPFNEATSNDVEVLPSTPANDDATYFGHATKTFAEVDVNLTTDGVGTWTITYEYWDGTSWTALSGVTDGTSGWVAGSTGWKEITFTLPTDWATTEVDSVTGYWIRGLVSGYSAVTTPPQVGQGWIILDAANADWADDTTDFTDAGTDDVPLLPLYPIVGDGVYFGHTEAFAKIKIVTGQKRTGTATIILKYWNGSAWTAVDTVDDDTVGYSANAGTLLINFVPPGSWVANTTSNGPNGVAGFFVLMELTALTSVTQQPLGTQGWVYPLKTGATGVDVPMAESAIKVTFTAQTQSGTTDDSNFILINTTTGDFLPLTWTKGDPHVEDSGILVVSEDDELALVQETEDGSTEFADANVVITIG